MSVVRAVVGVQAQVPSAAALSLWARVADITPAEVDDALYGARSLARTWAMRSTVHLVTREDQPLLAAAIGPSAGGIARWLAGRGLTGPRYQKLRDAILDALADGPLTRAQIVAGVTPRIPGSDAFFGSWGGVMRLLAQQGLIVFGPSRNQQTTFVRTEQWWPRPERTPAREHALAEILRRYLGTYGPATLADFSYWTGLPVSAGREAVQALDDAVAETHLNGRRTSYLLRADLPALHRARPDSPARLLPNFDVFLLGHKDKSLLVEPRHYKAIYRQAGWISQTVLLNGRIAGTWTHRRRGITLEVTLHPFGRLPRGARRDLRDEAGSLAKFLGASRVVME